VKIKTLIAEFVMIFFHIFFFRYYNPDSYVLSAQNDSVFCPQAIRISAPDVFLTMLYA